MADLKAGRPLKHVTGQEGYDVAWKYCRNMSDIISDINTRQSYAILSDNMEILTRRYRRKNLYVYEPQKNCPQITWGLFLVFSQ